MAGNGFWPGGTETAFTVIPNFLVTGFLVILVSLAVVIWSGWFIARKHGAVVFLLLSVLQFLVGGGFAQIFLLSSWIRTCRLMLTTRLVLSE